MMDCFRNSASPGSHNIAASSGYINFNIFVTEYLPFFMRSTGCTKDKPVLLILDYHVSHCSLEAVELCCSSGAVLLTLQPHFSHRLQPLDSSVYGPMKNNFYSAEDDWTRSKPGRSLSIHEMESLGGTVFTKAMNTSRIFSRLPATGFILWIETSLKSMNSCLLV